MNHRYKVLQLQMMMQQVQQVLLLVIDVVDVQPFASVTV
jgi:hypothetical protein